jgi:hypothetical protein
VLTDTIDACEFLRLPVKSSVGSVASISYDEWLRSHERNGGQINAALATVQNMCETERPWHGVTHENTRVVQ